MCGGDETRRKRKEAEREMERGRDHAKQKKDKLTD
jgi:hypothetical protein